MTSPQADGADRFSRAAERPLRASAAAPALAILLLLGLVLRLTIAYVLWPGSGFESDIATYTAWAQRLFEVGPGAFYEAGMFADYPPAYLYVLWLGSHLLALFHGGSFDAVSPDALKLWPILADIGVAAALFLVARAWAGQRSDGRRIGLIAAGLYLFNPVTWYDSALWGQTDAVGALVILLCVAALARGNSEGATALAVLAALVKPQFGVVAVPIVAAVLLRRHLLSSGSGPRNRPWAPRPVARWLAGEQGVLRLVSSAVVGMLTLLAVITPFGLSVPGYVERMIGTAGGYPWLSVNAYNPWALLGADGRQPLALGGGWSPDTVPFLGPVPAVAIGALLLVGAFAAGMLRLGWRADRRSILIVAIFFALAFFVLPTRVHERYLFPVFALVPLLAALDRRWLLALVGMSVAAFINFHGILTTPLYATPNLESLPLGDFFREPLPIVVSIALVVVTFIFVARRLAPSAAAQRDPYELAADEGGPAASGYDGSSRPAGAAFGAAGLVGQALRQLLSVAPVRRDRSAELASERGGRIERLDVLLLVLILLATLGLRTFRLETPFGMHFDEVYHARTATEFLHFWRYGATGREPHPIYEYTHPHLAKYVMAGSIAALGNNRVVAQEMLGAQISGAALERRWSTDEEPNRRNGDRLYLATGSDVRVIDLAGRREEGTIALPGRLVAVDESAHALLVLDAAGGLWRLSTAELDAQRNGGAEAAGPVPEQIATIAALDGEPSWLATADGRAIVATDAGQLVSIDAITGAETGRATLSGAAEALSVRGGERVVVDTAQVTDVASVALQLAELLDEDVEQISERLSAADGTRAVVAGYIDPEVGDEIEAAVTDGTLSGVTVEAGGAIAVAAADGVSVLDTASLDVLWSLGTTAPATGLALVERGLDQQTIYAAAGDVLVTIRLPDGDPPERGSDVAFPNDVRDPVWNPSTALLHVLGTRPDGSGPTVYIMAPVASSIFADAALDFEPAALLVDVQPRHPAEDRADLVALGSDGTMATIDAGSNAFAWRFPGVVAGALMAALIYLLARFLFHRRSVAVLAGLFVLVDGMFFANARIAMNDPYVALFIVAAFTIFAPLWLGRWRSRAAIAGGLLAVGVLLGLGLASKWVTAYAIGALGLLILVRSALGRIVALLGMIVLTGVLGYMAVAPPPETANPQLNFVFLLLMIGLTLALAALMALRPVRFTAEELRLAVGGPIAVGAVLAALGFGLLFLGGGGQPGGLLTPSRVLALGAGLLVAGVAAWVAAQVLGRFRIGPLAEPVAAQPGVEPAGPPAPPGWLRPGSGLLGLPWLAALAVITVLPLAIYVVSYVPWIELGNRWTTDLPAGHTGQTFLDLQVSMYDYHNNLRATHAASSPWWAWPLDLKPVWFYKDDFAGRTTAQIYDAGNIVLFWLSLPALGFAVYQAWRRRSLALTLVVVAVAALWLPWARIDRVAFQYHIFTSLPFWFLGLAYFLAELWHGPSRRTWALARVAAAVMIVAPAALWLLRQPLCAIARVDQVNAGGCAQALETPFLSVTELQLTGLAALMLLLLVVPAVVVLRARDARRFVVGVVIAAAAWFVVWYPNIAALPVPSALAHAYQGFLPTWNYAFQFGSNQDAPNRSPIETMSVAMLVLLAAMLAVAAAYIAREWRTERAEERAWRAIREPG